MEKWESHASSGKPKRAERFAGFYERNTGAGRWKQEIPARHCVLREFQEKSWKV
jgi:hypothetical protein